MRHYYAQIDGAGICVALLDTHQPMAAAHMIAIGSFDTSLLGRHWNGAGWDPLP